MSIINDTNRFNLNLAYTVYSHVYDNWKQLSDREQKKARRQVESMIREGGFNGNRTGLISEAALQTVINQNRGIKPTIENRTAIEHPVTYTNVATYCLNQDKKMSFDEYFQVWVNNLVTNITTNEENMRLKTLQSKFKFGSDCWKKMYELAGIKLVKRPDLRAKESKLQRGLN